MDTVRTPVHQSQLPQPLPAAYVPPVSVDWESWDKQPSGASVLPAPCFSPPTSLYTGCSEVSLMRAVLEDALACVHRPDETADGGSSARHGRLRSGFLAMTPTGFSPTCRSARCLGWSRHPYGRSFGAGAHPTRTCGSTVARHSLMQAVRAL